jgi:4-hydroxybenzoyl-CoA thioesterase
VAAQHRHRLDAAGVAPNILAESFTLLRPVRFADCDPAGIVYFPRFLEMANDLTEEWFARGLGMPFDKFHLELGHGIPVVNTKVDFLKACRLGERLELELSIEALGRSSVVLRLRGHVAGEDRLKLRHKLAVVSLAARRAVAIPEDLRARMERFLVPGAPATPDPATHNGKVPPNAFRSRQLVRFAHCDPAGVVFYPRFFEMFSTALEDWFQTGLACPFGGEFMMERGLRIPGLAITAEFLRSCRMGEFLDVDLWVTRTGRSSIDLALACSVAGEPRVRSSWAVCIIDFASFKSTPIPADLRERMRSYQQPS